MEIEELILELKKRGFLNDTELAVSFTKSQKKKGYGPAMIAYKLRQKAGEVHVDLVEDEEILYAYIEKRYLKDLPEKRDKVIRSLMRKGHSYELINKVLGTIVD